MDPGQTASCIKLALLAREMRSGSRGINILESEPIAIVGMACRFPGGAHTPDRFWRILAEGIDAIREVPQDRWKTSEYYDPDSSAPGKMVTRHGGFLENVDLFDSEFFGISPREAARMDPQQRLFLEVAWEALNDAGRTTKHLSGTPTGVFLAVYYNDYARMQLSDPASIDAYSLSGTAHSLSVGRLSYLLNLRGPSMVIDTACSSSLVAVHLACQSLRLGETDMSVAGGVNLMIRPEENIPLSKWGLVAPDGRCKTFDSRADGFVRGEGCGVIVLKRLADALSDGDRVHAIVRGSAVNQDGRSNFLTAPNGLAQEAVILEALKNARVEPVEISYVEAHGTGTKLGDPIEAEALAKVVGQTRPDGRTCAIGSVKTNIGHLEAAAGIAGLIKVVLSMQHGRIPPHLHFKTLNPFINLEQSCLTILPEGRPWPTGNQPRFAGVSSFGFGGTNAHAVIEEAPRMALRDEKKAQLSPGGFLLPLSAKTSEGLEQLARAYSEFLREVVSGRRLPLRDICYTASVKRDHHGVRSAFFGRSHEEMVGHILQFLGSCQETKVEPSVSTCGHPKIAFVFSGEGSHWIGMVRQLMKEEEAFHSKMEECHALFLPMAGWALMDAIISPEPLTQHPQKEILQPLLFAVHVSLFHLWASWGVIPDAVLGYGLSEIAAAHVGGALRLQQALELILNLTDLPRHRDTSPAPFSQTGSIPIFSASLGVQLEGYTLNLPSWMSRMREPRLLDEAIDRMVTSGCTFFVDISPAPCVYIHDCLKVRGGSDVSLETLKPGQTLRESMFETLGKLYSIGREVQWENLFTVKGQTVSLPPFPWQRQRHWIVEPRKGVVHQHLLQDGPSPHSFLGTRLLSPFLEGVGFENVIADNSPHFLADHRIGDRSVVPAAAFIEMAVAAANEEMRAGSSPSSVNYDDTKGLPVTIENLTIHEALMLPGESTHYIQLGLNPEGADSAFFRIFSRPVTPGAFHAAWKLHASGKVGFSPKEHGATARNVSKLSPQIIQKRCLENVTPEMNYDRLAKAGLQFGPAFRGVEAMWRNGLEVLGRISVTESVSPDLEDYWFHPALLDACLQVVGALLPHSEDNLFIPIGFERIQLFSRPAGPLWSHGSLRELPEGRAETLSADILVFDDSGKKVASLVGMSLRAVRPEKLVHRDIGGSDEWFYQVSWLPQPLNGRANESAPSPESWIILADSTGAGAQLGRRLQRGKGTCIEFYHGREFLQLSPDRYRVNPDPPEDFIRLLGEIFRKNKPGLWGIVHLWSLDLPNLNPAASESVTESQRLTCGAMLHLLKALKAKDEQSPIRLWTVTRGAQDVGGPSESIDPFQAPLWGMGSVIGLERPDIECVYVDLDPSQPVDDGLDALFDEICLGSSAENRVAIRNGSRYVARLTAVESAPAVEKELFFTREEMELRAAENGLIDDLKFHPATRRPPKRGEIEIQVETAGLNFRDVLNALRMLPGMETPLGGECSGRVVRVGEDVDDFSVGDQVLAFAAGSFRSFVTVSECHAFLKPAEMSFEEAASIPIIFLTAHYGLRHLTRLSAGEKILIHAASGGVGLAAVQIAQRAGAEIFATAGTPEKREYLRSIGVEHVLDSRSSTFADTIRDETHGEGVDVVLNSLSGDMIARSLSILKTGGSFIEIGKREIWDETRMARFKSGISYFPFDLGQVAEDNPSLFKAMFTAVMRDFQSGALKPVRRTVFRSQNAVDAFRIMARAKHIGKIILSFREANASRQAAPLSPIRADATYLITGGLGALGLMTAKWLIDRGARHLALVGRREPTETANRLLREWGTGANVSVFQADVTIRPLLKKALDEIRHTMPPLRGIIHAAGIIDDGVLLNQDWHRFARVMSPKVDGTWNLHLLTKDLSLDFFVMFSSAASIVGWLGQGNYAAANAFLDAIAHYRRRSGLTALSINWGPWAEQGMAAGLEAPHHRRVAAKGVEMIKPADALSALGTMLMTAVPQIAALRVDWGKFTNDVSVPRQWFFPKVRMQPFGLPRAEPQKEMGTALLRRLNEAPTGERIVILADHIERQVTVALGMGPGKLIDRRRSFQDIGLDSLMSVELSNALGKELGRTLPPTLVFDYPTIDVLAGYLAQILGRVDDQDPPRETVERRDAQVRDAPDLQHLSEEEAEALLMKEIEGLRKGK